jgi:hypothetical protein
MCCLPQIARMGVGWWVARWAAEDSAEFLPDRGGAPSEEGEELRGAEIRFYLWMYLLLTVAEVGPSGPGAGSLEPGLGAGSLEPRRGGSDRQPGRAGTVDLSARPCPQPRCAARVLRPAQPHASGASLLPGPASSRCTCMGFWSVSLDASFSPDSKQSER